MARPDTPRPGRPPGLRACTARDPHQAPERPPWSTPPEAPALDATQWGGRAHLNCGDISGAPPVMSRVCTAPPPARPGAAVRQQRQAPVRRAAVHGLGAQRRRLHVAVAARLRTPRAPITSARQSEHLWLHCGRPRTPRGSGSTPVRARVWLRCRRPGPHHSSTPARRPPHLRLPCMQPSKAVPRGFRVHSASQRLPLPLDARMKHSGLTAACVTAGARRRMCLVMDDDIGRHTIASLHP